MKSHTRARIIEAQRLPLTTPQLRQPGPSHESDRNSRPKRTRTVRFQPPPICAAPLDAYVSKEIPGVALPAFRAERNDGRPKAARDLVRAQPLFGSSR